MATSQVTNSSYAGEKAAPYISLALLSANTLEAGGVVVKQNIKYKEVVKTLAVGSGIIQDMDCDFTANSSVTVDERIIEPKPFKVNLELCKDPYRSDWDAAQMGYSAWDKLPASFEDYLLGEVAANVATDIEKMIWNGDDSNAGEFDGFITLATADADVIDISAPLTIDSSNVIGELGRMVDAIPAELYGAEDSYIYIPQNVHRAYIRALGGFGANGLGAAGYDSKGNMWAGSEGVSLSFDGVKLFVANGMPSNRMMFARQSNLWFGCGMLNDENEVRVIDRTPVTGDDNVRIGMRFTAAVQYGFGGEIVLY